jgi:hypothetical protein
MCFLSYLLPGLHSLQDVSVAVPGPAPILQVAAGAVVAIFSDKHAAGSPSGRQND